MSQAKIFSLLNQNGTSLPVWRKQQAVAQNCQFSMPQLPDCHPASEKKNPQKGKQQTEKLPIVRVISGPSGDGNRLFSNSRETGTQTAVK